MLNIKIMDTKLLTPQQQKAVIPALLKFIDYAKEDTFQVYKKSIVNHISEYAECKASGIPFDPSDHSIFTMLRYLYEFLDSIEQANKSSDLHTTSNQEDNTNSN